MGSHNLQSKVKTSFNQNFCFKVTLDLDAKYIEKLALDCTMTTSFSTLVVKRLKIEGSPVLNATLKLRSFSRWLLPS